VKKIYAVCLAVLMVFAMAGVAMAEELPECAGEYCSDDVRSEGDSYCRGSWCANEPEEEEEPAECAYKGCSDDVRSEGDNYCRGSWCKEWDTCTVCEKAAAALSESTAGDLVCADCLADFYECAGGCGKVTDAGPDLYCPDCKEEEEAKEEEEEAKEEEEEAKEEEEEETTEPVDREEVEKIVDDYIRTGKATPPTGGAAAGLLIGAALIAAELALAYT